MCTRQLPDPCFKTERNCHKWLMQCSIVTFLRGTCTKLLSLLQYVFRSSLNMWPVIADVVTALTQQVQRAHQAPPVLLEQRG
ncbi:hypothetical protein CFP56_030705 [Quercus suber]|uniref:Uncharacterized protein n=1 Tax=Quercus suber TaxID=58331 RepID=A0AAW0JMA6_QUESU